VSDSPTGRKRSPRGGSVNGLPASAEKTLQQGLVEIRQRFVATFVGQCDAIRALVDQVAALHPRGPVAALTQVTHRLSGLAGTIGFPTVSARASDLENLVAGAGGREAFDASAARDAVDAIRNALAKDLAKVSKTRGANIIIADEQSDKRAIGTASLEAVPTGPSIRVLIVDDHSMVRRGLMALLSEEFHGAAFGEAADAQQAVEQLRKNHWDVALLDITLPGKSGLDLLKELKAEWPRLPVLVLSGHKEEQFAVRVLKAGAGGYMTKESAPEELAKAVRKVLAGGRYVSPGLAEKLALGVTKDLTRTPHETLSDREYDVMSRIGSGRTVTEIAEDLSLSAKTISTYRARVLEKLGVKNSAEIVQYAIRNGLVM
jgi:two-component system, NarL family, invasion response regulator UvrY